VTLGVTMSSNSLRRSRSFLLPEAPAGLEDIVDLFAGVHQQAQVVEARGVDRLVHLHEEDELTLVGDEKMPNLPEQFVRVAAPIQDVSVEAVDVSSCVLVQLAPPRRSAPCDLKRIQVPVHPWSPRASRAPRTRFVHPPEI